MTNNIKTNLARLLLLLSVVLSTPQFVIFDENVISLINIQLVLIFVLRICSPSTNFKNLWFLSIVSLVNDSLSGLTFGTTGILYLIILSVASFQASIKLRSIFLSEWIAFIIALVLAYVSLILIDLMTGANFSVSEILLNYIFTIIVYPFIWYPLSRVIYA